MHEKKTRDSTFAILTSAKLSVNLADAIYSIAIKSDSFFLQEIPQQIAKPVKFRFNRFDFLNKPI